MRRIAVTAVVGVIAVGTLAAGCGSGDPRPTADAAASTTTPTTTARPSPTTAPATTTIGAPPGAVLPASPAQVAAVLADVETALRVDEHDDAEAARLGRAQDLAYLALRERPEWVPEVLASLAEPVRAVVATNLRAGERIGGLAQPRPELPSWRIRSPRPAGELMAHYREAEAASGAPWEYLAAIHLVETRMGRIVGTSTAGAQGPMQFMPPTWAAFGDGDVHDDRDAILAAGRYLAASGAPADMGRALFAYNRSDRYVEAVSAYASVIRDDPRAYAGYHQWQVHYRTTEGRHLLPEGYPDVPAVLLGP